MKKRKGSPYHYLATLLTTDKQKYNKERQKGQEVKEALERLLYPVQEKIIQINSVLDKGVQLFDTQKASQPPRTSPKRSIERKWSRLNLRKLCDKTLVYWITRRFAAEKFKTQGEVNEFFAERTLKEYIDNLDRARMEDGIIAIKQMILIKAQNQRRKNRQLNLLKEKVSLSAQEKKHRTCKNEVQVKSSEGNGTLKLFPVETFVKQYQVSPRPNIKPESTSIVEEAVKKFTEHSRALRHTSNFFRRRSETEKPSPGKKLEELKQPVVKRNKSVNCVKAETFMKKCDTLREQYKKAGKGVVRMRNLMRKSISSIETALKRQTGERETHLGIKRIIANSEAKKRCFVYGRSGKGKFLNATTLLKEDKLAQEDYSFAKKYLRYLPKDDT